MPPPCSNPAAPAACTPVDIPIGWDPRTNQKPTGLLIAPPAARPVLFQIPLRRLKKTSTRMCYDFSLGRLSYWLGPAAKQSHAMALFTAFHAAALFKSRLRPKKATHKTCVCFFWSEQRDLTHGLLVPNEARYQLR